MSTPEATADEAQQAIIDELEVFDERVNMPLVRLYFPPRWGTPDHSV